MLILDDRSQGISLALMKAGNLLNPTRLQVGDGYVAFANVRFGFRHSITILTIRACPDEAGGERGCNECRQSAPAVGVYARIRRCPVRVPRQIAEIRSCSPRADHGEDIERNGW